jgi:hypothetical protein
VWWGRHLGWSKTVGVVAASDAIGRYLFGVVRILMKIVGVARGGVFHKGVFREFDWSNYGLPRTKLYSVVYNLSTFLRI